MLLEVMQHVKNYFRKGEGKSGRYVIENGHIDLPFLLPGQYYMLDGSVFNDGVYLHPAELKDEVFYGTITPLAIPQSFLLLVEEIEDYQSKNAPTPYQSESFGGYSYSMATNENGKLYSWKDAFGTRLNPYRKT